jgi:hypothetical protein
MNIPAQKISQSKKNKAWYIENIEAVCLKTRVDHSYINTWRNQRENLNLSRGILDVYTLGKELDFQNVGIETYPIPLKHIGIGNSKLNVLLGDYYSRPFDFKCTVSVKDEEGVTRKETDLKNQLMQRLNSVLEFNIKSGKFDEAAAEKEMQKIAEWSTYEYQDIAEITANKILKFEVVKNNIQYTLSEGFQNLLVQGKVAFLIDDFAGEIKLTNLNPIGVTSYGGHSKWIHERDYILIEEYKSIGQLYDDYYEYFDEADRKALEEYLGGGYNAYWKAPEIFTGNILDRNTIGDVFPPGLPSNATRGRINDLLDTQGHGIIYDKNFVNRDGDFLCITAFWKSRRKIGIVTFFDELGIENTKYVSEGYSPDKYKGETIKWVWVNEWCRTTKIGPDIYIRMGPVEASAKSLTNLSTGLPPVIGVELDYSMFDSIKHLDLSYDKAYWKSEMLMAQMQGTKTALNATMIPRGVDPNEWMHMSNIDPIILLDPAQEILSGPMESKSAAQATNTFITQDIKFGANHEQLQALRDYMISLEYTMGKICGVNDTRAGEIEERQAVRNSNMQMEQVMKITEHWFQLYDQLTKTVFKKYLEVCKKVYRDYPIKGSFILNDLGQEFIKYYSEFAETEFDVHTNRATEDKELFAKLKASVDNAIAQGSGSYEDLMAIYSTNSIQDIAKRLRENAKRIMEQQAQIKEQELAAEKEKLALAALESQKTRDHEMEMKLMELDMKKYEIDSKAGIDSEADLVDDTETDIADIALRQEQLNETKRHNKAVEIETERNNKEKNSIAKRKPAPSKTK